MAATIAIVEDNADEAILIKHAVQKAAPDLKMELFDSGSEALKYVRNCSVQPHLMLLDLKMPGMDGIEVLTQLRGHLPSKYLPVVMLTSSSLDADVRASYDAGANGFVTKAHDLGAFTRDVGALIHYWKDVNLSPR